MGQDPKMLINNRVTFASEQTWVNGSEQTWEMSKTSKAQRCCSNFATQFLNELHHLTLFTILLLVTRDYNVKSKWISCPGE